MKTNLFAIVWLATAGAAPDVDARFRGLQNASDAKWTPLTGVQVSCLVTATEDFKLALKDDPLVAKYGSSIDDFDVVVIEKQGRCIVAISARGKKTGTGLEYWIEGRQVVKKGYAK